MVAEVKTTPALEIKPPRTLFKIGGNGHSSPALHAMNWPGIRPIGPPAVPPR